MKNFCGVLLIVFVVFGLNAQNTTLPSDFRQQNLTEYNASLLNPAYSLDRNNPSSLGLWTRWQWQTPDGDPTTLFFNYTTRLNDVSSAGVGFFQHNTGIFLSTGAAFNYAFNIELDDDIFLGVGLNVFAFQQKLADDRFFVPNPIQNAIENDFVLQMAPGINLNIDRFNLGLTSENLFDYNLSTNERNTSPDERIFQALASYDFPLTILKGDNSSVLRPALYYKSIPGLDSQFGITSLLTTNKFWAQGGYNSFYGVSAGAGGRFFKRFSLGFLVEVGTSNDLNGSDPSFEFVTSYKLGKLTSPAEKIEEQLIAEKEEEEKLAKNELMEAELSKAEVLALKREAKKQERQKQLKAKQIRDSILLAERSSALAEQEFKRDSIKALKTQEALVAKEIISQKRERDSLAKIEKSKKEALAILEQKAKDSIANAKAIALADEQKKELAALAEAKELNERKKQQRLELERKAKEEAIALEQKRKQDSIIESKAALAEAEKRKIENEANLAQNNEVVKPEAGEKYEEVAKEGQLAPGYYLIANVFGTKRYLDAFMLDLEKKGLNPKSFFRDLNKYNYVYLAKFNSIKDAREARDSKLNGTYTEKLWIFRVTGDLD